MDIQIGKIYKNKTFNFLVPILSDYPVAFKQKISQQVSKLAYGIYDKILDKTEIVKDNHRPIFILCDKLSGNFDNFIIWLKTQEYYITDYTASYNINSRYHMIVIDTIEEHHNTYDKFITGLYSEMYSEKDIDRLFSADKSDIIGILTKDKLSINKFISKVRDTFNVDVNDSKDFYDDIKECEFPYKLSESEEVFNYS